MCATLNETANKKCKHQHSQKTIKLHVCGLYFLKKWSDRWCLGNIWKAQNAQVVSCTFYIKKKIHYRLCERLKKKTPNVTNQINSQTHWTEWGVRKGEAAGSENK